MIHIEKHPETDVVRQHEQELRAAGLDRLSLAQRIAQGEVLKQKELYRAVRARSVIPHFKALLGQMCEEQGGICCYCGAKLCFPDSQHYSVEHVLPRTANIELVGEYDNLLLSCHASEQEQKEIKENVERRTDRKSYFHCDEHKGSDTLNYTPLDEGIASHFRYKTDGVVEGCDERAQDDVDVLNLNCQTLQNRRKDVIDAIVFADDLSSEELRLLSDRVMLRDEAGNRREFCFVIKGVIDGLLGS